MGDLLNMYNTETGCRVEKEIEMAQDGVQWQIFSNLFMKTGKGRDYGSGVEIFTGQIQCYVNPALKNFFKG
jgi:hypothetical protein